MSRFAHILWIVIFSAATLYASGEIAPSAESRVSISSVEPNSIALAFNLEDVTESPVEREGAIYATFPLEEEGCTYEYGKPALPAVSRFIIVPADVGLALETNYETPRGVRSVHAPALCWDEEIRGDTPANTPQYDGLYPPNVAEMSDPIVIRGVRIVKVTVHPVQYNPQTEAYLFHRNIETRIRYTADEPVNPAEFPVRIQRSRQFLRYLEGMVENPEAIPNRDDPEFVSPYVGYYLIVARVEAINHARPFIEWRRKSGWKVDILPVSANDGPNPGTVKNAIQQRYDNLRNQGLDPFDHILIIGDRSDYSGLGPGPQWVIQSFTGNSTWPNPPHADYEFALLEGNDIHMDAAISRWPSGNQQTMELFVGRTLAYEAAPRMQDPTWFTRGGVGSQHWGNQENSAWHVTIHTNVRWGVEVLEQLGYRDVRFQERYEWDQMGQVYGPWVRDLLNAGPNVILDRAENYFWRSDFNGVNNNTVFPVRLNLSGHGEWTTWNMIRTGDGNNLKGPVATTNSWGGPPTAPMSVVWLGLVHGVMIEDLTLGWGRIKGNTGLESFFPNINVGGNEIYRLVKTDFDCYGDPGIQVWRGVPRLVEMNHPDTISLGTKLVEVYVHAPGEVGTPIEGAQVSLYVPGQLPQDPTQYAQFQTFMRTAVTDREGIVRFVLTGVNNFAAGDMFITTTGRDIRPLFGRIQIVRPSGAPEIADFTLDQVEGNDDDDLNPGESFRLSLSATNAGNRTALHNLTAVISAFSPWLEVGDNQISFGDVDPGATADGNDGVVLTLNASCPDAQARAAQQPSVIVTFDSDEGSWRNALNIDAVAPNFTVNRLPGGNTIPAELRRVNVELKNIGRMNSQALTGRLVSMGMGVSVIDDQMTFGAINAGAQITNQGDGFLVSGNTIVPPGFINPMALILTTQSGFTDTARFSLQVGTTRENAPTGPDRYGYICFDNTDEAWDLSPDYDWVEIDPRDQNAEFEGTALNFAGRSEADVGETLVIPLGFETRYYGVLYDSISVCTNGFIAMGNQRNITNFQNWPLDRGFAGGAGMMAPFWDWLTLGQ
ncbi:MAG: C25 family cysteine peptidase, partial [Calditrichota bacterium]